MTTRLYLKKMPSLGGTDVEISAFTGRRGSPFFDHQDSLVEMGMRYGQGEASQGEWFLMDPEQDFITTFGASMPDAHWLVTWTEDGPGAETWLSRGRVGTDEGGREGVIIDDELAFRVTVDDGNVDLRGQAFTESWVRPEETDIQRLVALQLYTLNGASSTATHHRDTCTVIVNTSHLAPNTNTVTMPAKKYLAGTQPDEVIRDCADTAGKMYGVVIHHTGGSHLCLLYITQDDHTTYLSPAKISDELTDWDPEDTSAPVWEPHWERGSGVILSMQTRLSGLVGIWGAENASFVEYAGVADATDYWVESYHDGDSTTQTQANNRTAGILEERRNNHLTHRVSVIVQPDQVDLIAAGMSLPWKTAVDDPDQYLTRRIAELRWEPRHDGTYWAHMDLERPLLRVAPGRGKVGPIPPVQSEPASGGSLLLPRLYPTQTGAADPGIHTSWDRSARVDGTAILATTTQNNGDTQGNNTVNVAEDDDTLLMQLKYVLTGTVVFTGGTVRGQGFGKMRSGVGIGNNIGQSQLVVRLMDSTNAVKAILLDAHQPAGLDSTQWSSEGTGGSNPPKRNTMYPADSQWTSPLGAPLASATGVATDYLLIEAGVRAFQTSGANGINVNYDNNNATDLTDNDQTETSSDNTWFEFWSGPSGFIGTPPPPAATGSTGTTGTSPIYSPADHQHPAQVAGITPITDEDEYFTGEDVETALQEVGADILAIEAELASVVTADQLAGFGVVGPILISDDHSTPIVFADILLTEEGDDILYSDVGG